MSFLRSLRKTAVCRQQLLKLPSPTQLSSTKLLAGALSEGFLVPSWVPVKYSQLGAQYENGRHYKSAPLQERKMIDRRRVHVKGGDGGDGCTSFRKSRHSRHGAADGGRGGKGGDVIFKCSEEFWDFGHLQHHFTACRGGNGSSKRKIGSRGTDKVVPVPKGTVIHLVSGEIPSLQDGSLESAEWHDDECDTHGYLESEEDKAIKDANDDELSDTVEEHDEDGELTDGSVTEAERTESDDSSVIEGSEIDESEQASLVERNLVKRVVAELVKVGETLTVAYGGEGGRGNAAMARGRGPNRQLPSKEHENGHPGTEAFLVLELKTIADVGFVGAPNAGKSTLLGAISRAKPKVGHYAFTTLRPNLGKLEFEDFYSITVADIPGLIKGAHKNVGLGHDFLRHIERTKVLAYVVDLSASVGDNKGSPPWVQYEDLKFELEMYQPGLSERPSVLVATKLDENGAKEMLEETKRRLPSAQILPVCALLEQGIHELRLALRDVVTSHNA